jgi:hypothetical protein
MKVEDLIKKYHKWTDANVKSRLTNAENGREWVYKNLEYTDDLTTKKYQDFFDRNDQNEEYHKRFINRNVPSKKPHGWYQNEINMIYGFHKCFAMRNATRLQYYRNDLSQKGARNLTAVNHAIGKFLFYKEHAEKPK